MHSAFPVSSYLWSDIFDTFWVVRRCSMYNCILCRLSTSVVKTDSEGWTMFLGRRIVLPFLGVSSPDCNQNRTGLVTVGRHRMRVVAGSEGATDKSTPDCTHCTLLYYSDSVLSCAYNQPVMPEDALCSTPLRLNKPPKMNMHRIKTPGIGAKNT